MKARGWKLAIWFALMATTVLPAAVDHAYQREIEAAREKRIAELTAVDGWLTLIGLHFLRDGPNTIGSAKENDVVLPKGPARVGTATLGANGKVALTLASDAGAKIDGVAVRSGELVLGQGVTVKPTLVTIGSLSFFLIERGEKKALRVKDSAAERRTHFVGLDFFPIDPAWRIEARWEGFEQLRLLPITNILGQTSRTLMAGKAVFEYQGRRCELLAIDEGPGLPLFFVISDATSGKETYAAARFIYADRPKGDRIVLDFNRAENPPCAFTPFATCPLPPTENRLPFAVTAGEKNYRGAHE